MSRASYFGQDALLRSPFQVKECPAIYSVFATADVADADSLFFALSVSLFRLYLDRDALCAELQCGLSVLCVGGVEVSMCVLLVLHGTRTFDNVGGGRSLA